MQNLILTTNVVLPVFLVMVVGYLCRRFGMVSADNVSAMNKLVFRLFLPASLVKSLMTVDRSVPMDYTVLLFALGGILTIFVLGLIFVPMFEKDNRRRGVILQGLFRSNYAIFGVPLCEALFAENGSGLPAMLVLVVVPIFNILAVVSLERYRGGTVSIARMLKGIAKNPLIWACIIGFVLMELGNPLPEPLAQTVGKLAAVSSPLALFVLGATIELRRVGRNKLSLTVMVLMRLLIVPAAALVVAYLMGIRGEAFGALMIVFGSPCAVSSYIMAAQMDGDGELAAQQVMITAAVGALGMSLLISVSESLGIF
ncbi:MAG: AEC family transporter [Clostridia bacterium]|nr:AEC family transporter [Clostridia bacterium]